MGDLREDKIKEKRKKKDDKKDKTALKKTD